MSVRSDKANYTPNKNVSQMERDMANIVMFLASAEDHVVAERPDEEFLHLWFPDGDSPTFVTHDEASTLLRSGENISPWGECRSLFHTFGLRDRANTWQLRKLLSRATSARLEKVACEMGTEEGLTWMSARPYSTLITTQEELEGFADRATATEKTIVLKSLWSASGRGVRFFDKKESAMDHGKATLRADGALIGEHKLERVAEASLLYLYDGQKATYLGLNVYSSSENGAFGEELHGGFATHEFDESLPQGWEATAGDIVGRAIEKSLAGSPYSGPAGVDIMLYRDEDGEVRIRPCMEINLRHCMGHVAQAVKRRIADGTAIRWRMGHFSSNAEWTKFCETESAKSPLSLDSDGRITSGFFRLTPLKSSNFGAYGYAWRE